MGRGYPAELSSDCHAPPVKDPVLDSLHSAVFFAFPWPSPLCLEGLLAQSPLDQGLTLCGKVDLVQLKGPCILSLSFILAPALLCALLQPRAFLCLLPHRVELSGKHHCSWIFFNLGTGTRTPRVVGQASHQLSHICRPKDNLQ